MKNEKELSPEEQAARQNIFFITCTDVNFKVALEGKLSDLKAKGKQLHRIRVHALAGTIGIWLQCNDGTNFPTKIDGGYDQNILSGLDANDSGDWFELNFKAFFWIVKRQ